MKKVSHILHIGAAELLNLSLTQSQFYYFWQVCFFQ